MVGWVHEWQERDYSFFVGRKRFLTKLITKFTNTSVTERNQLLKSKTELHKVKLVGKAFKLSVRKIFKRKRRSAQRRRSHKKFPLSIYEVCSDIKYKQSENLLISKNDDSQRLFERKTQKFKSFPSRVIILSVFNVLECFPLLFQSWILNPESWDDARWERVSLSWNISSVDAYSLLKYAR